MMKLKNPAIFIELHRLQLWFPSYSDNFAKIFIHFFQKSAF